MNARLREAIRNGVADPWAASVHWKDAPSPPPPPDYGAAARAQGAANVETARAQGRMSNPNISTPLGKQTVTWGNGDYERFVAENGFAPEDAYGGGAYQRIAQLWKEKTGQDAPSANARDQAQITQTLTPEGQARFDQEQRMIGQLGGVAERGIGRVDNAMSSSFDTSGLPARTTSVHPGDIQRGLDYSGVARIPGTDDFSADRQRVEEAIYSRLNPQFERDENAMRTRLINSGIRVGTDAYDAEMNNFNKAKNDARMQAIVAGGGEQSRLFGLGLAARQQGVGEVNTRGGFANSAEAQEFGERMQNANLTNTGRQNAMQEALTLRQLPLNEVNALRSGSQVTLPQFQPYQGASVQPPPLFNATMAQGQGARDIYNAQTAGANAGTSGLFNLAGSALGAYGMYAGLAASDRRLKSNIQRIGTHPLGIGVYEYDIFGHRERGVMADEVEKVKPEAVVVHPDGYKMVAYGLL